MGYQDKNKGHVLEVDTDGILLDKLMPVDKINSFIKRTFKREFNIPEDQCTLEMEMEEFEGGFIHKMKNYILLVADDSKENGIRAIKHGAYFTSSRAPKVYDDAVQLIVDYTMHIDMHEGEIRTKALDILKRPLADFVMRVRMNKKISEYFAAAGNLVAAVNDDERFNPIVNETAHADWLTVSGVQMISLAREMMNVTGVMPDRGITIPYVVTTDYVTGKKKYSYFNPRDDTLADKINYGQYEKQITKMLDATNIAPFSKTRQEVNLISELLGEDIF